MLSHKLSSRSRCSQYGLRELSEVKYSQMRSSETNGDEEGSKRINLGSTLVKWIPGCLRDGCVGGLRLRITLGVDKGQLGWIKGVRCGKV